MRECWRHRRGYRCRAARSGRRTGAGGLDTTSSRASSLCGRACVLACNEAFSMSEMVYVAVQKRGGKNFQPMGRVSGKATSCYPQWVPGDNSPSFGESAGLSPIRYKPSASLAISIYTDPSLGYAKSISLISQSSSRPYCMESISIRGNVSAFIWVLFGMWSQGWF